MATLLFFDQGHKYTVDGEEVPSVSELCRFLSREIYGEVAQFRLDTAAERGTAVHKSCESLDKYGECEVNSNTEPYVRAYHAFRQENSVEWEKIEFATHHPSEQYAGTIDRYGTLNGKRVILDIKTSYTIHKPLAVAQLNLYRRMMQFNGFDVEELYILHLKKDATYKLQKFDFNDDIPIALIALHNLLKKKKRGKKNA